MGRIDLEAVNKLRSIIKTNLGFVEREYRNKSRSISSKMDSVMSSYSEYSDVTSKARQIKQMAAKINSEANSIERMTQRIVDGLKGAIDLVKAGENESKKIIRETNKKIQVSKINDRSGSRSQKAVKGLNMKESAEISLQATIKSIQSKNDIQMYEKVLQQYRREGRTDTGWIEETLKALQLEYEGKAVKPLTEAERKEAIDRYSNILNQCRQSGRGEPEWLLEILERLGAPYGVKEDEIKINGVVMPRTGRIGELSEEEVAKDIEAYLNEKGMTLEGFLASKGQKYANIYTIMTEYGCAEDRDKMVLYLLTMNEQGREVTQRTLPKWWNEKKQEVRSRYVITEDNYGAYSKEFYDFYNSYVYIEETMLSNTDEMPINKATTWYEEQYGHLDKNSDTVQRTKYLMEKAGIVSNAKNQDGLYDNEKNEAYKASVRLFVSLYGLEDAYYDQNIIRRSNESFLVDQLNQIVDGKLKPITAERNLEVERKISQGQYINFQEIANLVDATSVKIEGNTVYWTETFDYYEVPTKCVKRTIEHSFTLQAVDYLGKKYVDKAAFQAELTRFTTLKVAQGNYQDQITNIGYDPKYRDKIESMRQSLEKYYPGITDDQVIYMVCQQMEVDQVMNWERQTNSDAFWEAAQEILDAAELVAVAGTAVFAPEVVGTAATIGTVTEIANTGISIYREDYDDAVIRAAGVIADVLPVGKAIDKVSDGGEVIIRSKSGEAIEIITEKGGKKQVEKIAYDIGDDIIDSSGKAARQVTPNIERTSLEEASDLVGDNVPPHMTEYSSTITKLDDATNGMSNISKSGTTTKPNQVHHFATNKSKKYTSQFESIAKKYGLDLDGDWNKELMPHQGRHPYAYHDYVLDNMQKFDRIANGDKTKFLKLYDQMKQKIINNPDMLYKDYWKK